MNSLSLKFLEENSALVNFYELICTLQEVVTQLIRIIKAMIEAILMELLMI